MRSILVPVLALLLAVPVALEIFSPPRSVTALPWRSTASPAAPAVQAPRPDGTAVRRAEAWGSVQRGDLRKAQDDYILILSANPLDQDGRRGLVVVRRLMAHDRPEVLRRQLTQYQAAGSGGVETDEHYTAEGLTIIAGAIEEALKEVEMQVLPQPVREAASARALKAAPAALEAAPRAGAKSAASAPLRFASMPVSPPSVPSPRTERKRPGPGGPPTIISTRPSAFGPAPRQTPASAGPAAKPAPPPPKTSLAAPPATAEASVVVPLATPPTAPGAEPTKSSPSPASAPPSASSAQDLSSARTPAVAGPAVAPAPISIPVPAPGGSTSAPASPSRPPNRVYAVRVGPIMDRSRAAMIVAQLAGNGFPARNDTSHLGYQALSEPLPRSAAEKLAATLAGRGIQGHVEPLTGDSAQVVFGTFFTQKEAEAAAQRISAQGYEAWVHEAVGYVVLLGPYPQSVVDRIRSIVKDAAPDATVQAEP